MFVTNKEALSQPFFFTLARWLISVSYFKDLSLVYCKHLKETDTFTNSKNVCANSLNKANNNKF